MPSSLTPEEIIMLRNMPESIHYPDRSQKFDFRKSEVIKFIERKLDIDLAQAVRVFEKSRRAKFIVYDPTQKAWMGCELMKPEPQGSADNGNEEK